MTLWIACPVYYDVPSFLILRQHLNLILDQQPRTVRFVVLDDTAGLDVEMKRLRELPGVDVVTPPFNLGHQRGLVYVARWITERAFDEDVIVTMDSDGEDRPEDVPRLLAALDAEPLDGMRIALAKRTTRQESRLFKSFYACFKLFFRVLTGTTIVTGNFAAYHVAWGRLRLLHPHFDLAYSSTLVTFGASAVYVPCPRGQRLAGQSKMGFSRLVMHGVRMLMPFVDRIAVRALLAFTATLVLCVVGSCSIVVVRLLTDLAVPGWATYSLLLLLLLSAVALGNLVVLFAVFSQSQGISLSNLEAAGRELVREPSPAQDR